MCHSLSPVLEPQQRFNRLVQKMLAFIRFHRVTITKLFILLTLFLQPIKSNSVFSLSAWFLFLKQNNYYFKETSLTRVKILALLPVSDKLLSQAKVHFQPIR